MAVCILLFFDPNSIKFMLLFLLPFNEILNILVCQDDLDILFSSFYFKKINYCQISLKLKRDEFSFIIFICSFLNQT